MVLKIGSGLIGLATLVFIALKLSGVIAWSWSWVLSPIWLPIATLLGLLVATLGLAVVLAWIDTR